MRETTVIQSVANKWLYTGEALFFTWSGNGILFTEKNTFDPTEQLSPARKSNISTFLTLQNVNLIRQFFIDLRS